MEKQRNVFNVGARQDGIGWCGYKIYRFYCVNYNFKCLRSFNRIFEEDDFMHKYVCQCFCYVFNKDKK